MPNGAVSSLDTAGYSCLFCILTPKYIPDLMPPAMRVDSCSRRFLQPCARVHFPNQIFASNPERHPRTEARHEKPQLSGCQHRIMNFHYSLKCLGRVFFLRERERVDSSQETQAAFDKALKARESQEVVFAAIGGPRLKDIL